MPGWRRSTTPVRRRWPSSSSGPAGGVAGAAHAALRLGLRDVLHLDIGGTTAKCSLVLDGRPTLKDEYRLEWSRLNPGYPVQVPVVDIVEIGAGGGSIARIADDGALTVGPESAGADPGPACYGQGGRHPTVTDAKLICGVLDPGRFAGAVRLDRAAAADAFAALAARMGRDVETAASAAIAVAEAKMINALKLVSVQRGHDPRDMALLVSGGAGPMHAASLGRELGVARVIVPPMAGLFSALGMLSTAPRVDVARTRLPADASRFRDRSGDPLRTRGRGAGSARRRRRPADRRNVDMRYRGQEHTVAVAAGPDIGDVATSSAFGSAHEKAYTFRLDGTPAELVTYAVTASAAAPRVEPAPRPAPPRSHDTHRLPRRILAGSTAFYAAVYDRDALPVGSVGSGPALVEEATSTTLVLPGQTFTVDDLGCLVIAEGALA